MGQAAQELVAAVLEHDRLGEHATEPRHPLEEPGRHPAAVERQVGAARPRPGRASRARGSSRRDAHPASP